MRLFRRVRMKDRDCKFKLLVLKNKCSNRSSIRNHVTSVTLTLLLHLKLKREDPPNGEGFTVLTVRLQHIKVSTLEHVNFDYEVFGTTNV